MRKISVVAATAACFMLTSQAMALKPMNCDTMLECLMGGKKARGSQPTFDMKPHVRRNIVSTNDLYQEKRLPRPKKLRRVASIISSDPYAEPLRQKPRRAMQVASLGGSGLADLNLSEQSQRSMVQWSDPKYPTGSIVVKTSERSLYYVMPGGQALRYAVGVGREGFEWSGFSVVERKAEWPDWRPPAEMIEREAENGHFIPDFMPGGPGNPLGARALYLGGRMYRIHGTNNEASIGGAVSSGCIRMMNADIIDLYGRAKVGTKVWVY